MANELNDFVANTQNPVEDLESTLSNSNIQNFRKRKD